MDRADAGLSGKEVKEKATAKVACFNSPALPAQEMVEPIGIEPTTS